MKRLRSWINPLCAGALLIALWYTVRRVCHVEAWLLPTPGEILKAAWQERSTLFAAVLITSRGAMLGFLMAVGGGFLLAMVLGCSRLIKESF